MNNQTVLLLVAIGVIIIVLFMVPSSENFHSGEYVPYQPNSSDLLSAESSVDCTKFPNSPACRPLPPVNPTGKDLDTCAPANGQWSIPGTGAQGRSTLNSPCCQPPDYSVAKNYKTCDDQLDMNNPIDKCIADCCSNVNAEANSYDNSWYPLAKCGCALFCANKDTVPHFKKFGTATHYITGDLGEARTSDSGDFIGGTGYDFSGM